MAAQFGGGKRSLSINTKNQEVCHEGAHLNSFNIKTPLYLCSSHIKVCVRFLSYVQAHISVSFLGRTTYPRQKRQGVQLAPRSQSNNHFGHDSKLNKGYFVAQNREAVTNNLKENLSSTALRLTKINLYLWCFL